MTLDARHDTTGFFSWDVSAPMASVTFEGAFIDAAYDLEQKHKLFAVLDELEASGDIRVVLLFSGRRALTEKSYETFVRAVAPDTGGRRAGRAAGSGSGGMSFARVQNALCQFILRTARSEKIVISCLEGEVASPFFGASLASDIRFVAGDVTIRLSHERLGIPPTGGLGYFLPRFIGQGRSDELLLRGGALTARELAALHLVNDILPTTSFRRHCIQKAMSLVTLEPPVIRYTKRLMRRDAEDLERYLDLEFNALSSTLKLSGH